MKYNFFELQNIPENMQIIINSKGYGKSYYELNRLKNKINKQKEVLDKIKELIKEEYSNEDGEIWHDQFKEIYKLLEEIE